jgi:hypothetical protein
VAPIGFLLFLLRLLLFVLFLLLLLLLLGAVADGSLPCLQDVNELEAPGDNAVEEEIDPRTVYMDAG